MPSSQRSRRLADQIQRDLSAILRNEVKDPRIGFITVTEVEVSSDLEHAKVYFTTLADPIRRAECLAGLERAAGYLRSALGKRLQLRTAPQLRFEYDESIERGIRVTRLIEDAVRDLPPEDQS